MAESCSIDSIGFWHTQSRTHIPVLILPDPQILSRVPNTEFEPAHTLLKLFPLVHYCDPATGVAIMDFVSGRPLSKIEPL